MRPQPSRSLAVRVFGRHGQITGHGPRAARVLSTLLFLLLGAGLLSHILFSSARDTAAVQAALDSDSLYAMGIRAIVFELQRDRLIESLRGGLFEMTPADTRTLLTRTYTAEDVSEKARDIHGALVEYTLCFPPRDTLFFLVSFREEKPVLLDSLMVYWRNRIASLPDCSPYQLGEIGFGAVLKGVGLKSDEGFAKDLPKCRPPRSIEKKLLAKLEIGIEEYKTSGSSSVAAFPNKDRRDYTKFRRTMIMARVFAHTGSWLFLLVLVLGTSTFVLARREGRRERARSLTWGLVGIAVVVALCGASARLWGHQIDLWSLFFDRPRAGLSTSAVNWFNVVFYHIHAVLGIAGTKAFAFAAACLVLAGLLWFTARRFQRNRGRTAVGTE